MNDIRISGRRPGHKVSRRAIWGWYLFDWASQPYFTLILTFIFAQYFANSFAPTKADGQAWWGYAGAVAGFTIAILSPILGSMADASGPRKPWIFVFSLMLVGGCSVLWFAAPGRTDLTVWILAGFVIATIGTEFATVFTNAMMPDLVDEEELGRLSGNGWAMGYVGGLLSLAFVLLFMVVMGDGQKTMLGLDPIFGLDPATKEGDRAAGPLSAIWYAIFVIPLFLFTPDTKRKMSLGKGIGRGLDDLVATLRKLAKNGNALLYLIASMVYRDALAALFAFGGIYAGGMLGWKTFEIGIFGIVLLITGIFGSWLGGVLDVRYGAKRVVVWSLVLLLACGIGIISTTSDTIFFVVEVTPKAAGGGLFSSLPEQVFLALGALIGAAAGPVQASSRTLLVRIAPTEQVTQYFGLYALTGKVTSFIGPLTVGIATDWSDSQRIGLIPMLVLFGLGLVLLFGVKPQRAE